MASSPQSPWAASRASRTARSDSVSARRACPSTARPARPRTSGNEPEGAPVVTQLITPMTRSVISSPDVQTATWFLGALSRVRLSGEQTGGAFSLRDNLARRGNASPVHVHDRDDETFF